MTFHVGQKVVRVEVDRSLGRGHAALRGKGTRTVIGAVYTIRAINVWPQLTMLRFEGMNHSNLIGINGSTIEPGYDSRGFRPLIERKTETGFAILKKICDDVRERERA